MGIRILVISDDNSSNLYTVSESVYADIKHALSGADDMQHVPLQLLGGVLNGLHPVYYLPETGACLCTHDDGQSERIYCEHCLHYSHGSRLYCGAIR